MLIHDTFLIKASVLHIGHDNLSRLGEAGFCGCAGLHIFQCSVKLPLSNNWQPLSHSKKLPTFSGKKYLISTLVTLLSSVARYG